MEWDVAILGRIRYRAVSLDGVGCCHPKKDTI